MQKSYSYPTEHTFITLIIHAMWNDYCHVCYLPTQISLETSMSLTYIYVLYSSTIQIFKYS